MSTDHSDRTVEAQPVRFVTQRECGFVQDEGDQRRVRADPDQAYASVQQLSDEMRGELIESLLGNRDLIHSPYAQHLKERIRTGESLHPEGAIMLEPSNGLRLPPFVPWRFTSDGRQLVVASSYLPGLLVVDIATGRIVKAIRTSDSAEMYGLELSADDRFALIGMREFQYGVLSSHNELWDLRTGEFVQSYAFPEYVMWYWRLSFAHRDSRIVAIERFQKMFVWDRDSGDLVATHALFVDEDGEPLRGSSILDIDRHTSRIVGVNGMEELAILQLDAMVPDLPLMSMDVDVNGEGSARGAKLLPDGILHWGYGPPHFEYLRENGMRVRRETGEQRLRWMEIDEEAGEFVGYGLSADEFWLSYWDTETGIPIRSIDLSNIEFLERNRNRAPIVSPDMRILATHDEFGNVSLRELPSLERLPHFGGIHTGRIIDFEVWSDPNTVYALYSHGALFAWNADTGEQLFFTEIGFHPPLGRDRAMELSADGKWIALFAEEGEISLLDAATGEQVAGYSNPERIQIRRLAFCANGDLLCLGFDEDRQITLDRLELQTSANEIDLKLELKASIELHPTSGGRRGGVYDLRISCFTPERSRLIVSDTSTLHAFDVESGAEISVVRKPMGGTAFRILPNVDESSAIVLFEETSPGRRTPDANVIESIRSETIGRFNLLAGIMEDEITQPWPWMERIHAIVANSDKSRLLVTGSHGQETGMEIDARSGEATCYFTWSPYSREFIDAKYLDGDRKCVTLEGDGSMVVWDLEALRHD